MIPFASIENQRYVIIQLIDKIIVQRVRILQYRGRRSTQQRQGSRTRPRMWLTAGFSVGRHGESVQCAQAESFGARTQYNKACGNDRTPLHAAAPPRMSGRRPLQVGVRSADGGLFSLEIKGKLIHSYQRLTSGACLAVGSPILP